MDPIPISRYLISDTRPSAPADFTSVTAVVLAGLPHVITIDQSTRLLVMVPTGLATTWRDLDPSTVISDSNAEVEPYAAPTVPTPPGDAAFAPARLMLQVNNRTMATMPLVAGVRRMLPDGASAGGVRLELDVISWTLTSGSMRGAGDFGSRLTLAWRRANAAVDQFSTPPPQPTLVKRLPFKLRLESLVGYAPLIAASLDPHLRYRKQKVFLR